MINVKGRKIGNSLGVILPAEVAARLRIPVESDIPV